MVNAIDNHTTQSIETLKNVESNLENANSSVAQYKTEVTTKVQHINGNVSYFTIMVIGFYHIHILTGYFRSKGSIRWSVRGNQENVSNNDGDNG